MRCFKNIPQKLPLVLKLEQYPPTSMQLSLSHVWLCSLVYWVRSLHWVWIYYTLQLLILCFSKDWQTLSLTETCSPASPFQFSWWSFLSNQSSFEFGNSETCFSSNPPPDTQIGSFLIQYILITVATSGQLQVMSTQTGTTVFYFKTVMHNLWRSSKLNYLELLKRYISSYILLTRNNLKENRKWMLNIDWVAVHCICGTISYVGHGENVC